MKLLTITAAALALGACTTVRYTPVPCIAEGQELPQEPPTVGDQLTGKADRDFQIVGGNLVRWQTYGRGLRSILEGCK